jgi:succinate-semialdehyde dehydrogenase/glutarate-semialdehyde dehydrogenase
MDIQQLSLFRDKAYINGSWEAGARKDRLNIQNPSTGAIIGSVANIGPSETEDAIAAAKKAFNSWRAMLPKERAKYLMRWHDLILKNKEELAKIMTAEQGKPLAEAMGEVMYGASFIEWFAEEGKRAYGDVIPETMPGKRFIVIKQPIGIVGAITPWNFPNAMITRKAAPALAAGCPIIIRPSEETPFSALALAALAEQAEIPEGVLQVITGDAAPIGEVLTTHIDVKKISFTGSTAVGKILMKQSASTLKKLSLELGGNAPFIVFDDADIDTAVEGLIACKFRNAGQTCVCANRIYLHEKIYDEFLEKFIAATKEVKVGDGFENDVNIGPLINEKAILKIETLLKNAKDNGAEIKLGGNRHSKGGNFFEPTIVTNLSKGMDLCCDEIFGPVAAIYKFADDEELIEMANDTQYGLASYFYSENIKRIFHVAESLEFGMVGINTGIVSTEAAPFGGIKQSGFGREGSRYGLDEYLQIKYLSFGEMG